MHFMEVLYQKDGKYIKFEKHAFGFMDESAIEWFRQYFKWRKAIK